MITTSCHLKIRNLISLDDPFVKLEFLFLATYFEPKMEWMI